MPPLWLSLWRPSSLPPPPCGTYRTRDAGVCMAHAPLSSPSVHARTRIKDPRTPPALFGGVLSPWPLLMPRWSAQCLQQLAVVNQIPVHRNQQQILHAMVSTHGEFLQGTQRLADMTDEEREWLCAVATLVCTCCVGNDPEAQVLAQGLLPLPRLLKMLVEVDDLVLVEVCEAVIQFIRINDLLATIRNTFANYTATPDHFQIPKVN